jgi:hypothetical protein
VREQGLGVGGSEEVQELEEEEAEGGRGGGQGGGKSGRRTFVEVSSVSGRGAPRARRRRVHGINGRPRN